MAPVAETKLPTENAENKEKKDLNAKKDDKKEKEEAEMVILSSFCFFFPGVYRILGLVWRPYSQSKITPLSSKINHIANQ